MFLLSCNSNLTIDLLLLFLLIFLSEQAALDHLVQRKDVDAYKIVVFGRSLGGAVGAAVTRNNPDKVMRLNLGFTL